ncbi:MAG: putative rane associated hydrolase [Bacteroidetes bacterium]|nr:putative rane associated hydrolase [Bacteroidota bacterium]
MKRTILKKSILLAVIIFSMIPLQSQELVSIPRIQGEIKFDGTVDDPCWQNIQPLQMVMHTPTFGNQPTEKSEVMICFDNTYIYVGARLFDSEAAKMLITSKKRDEGSNSNESLSLVFDSFNGSRLFHNSEWLAKRFDCIE